MTPKKLEKLKRRLAKSGREAIQKGAAEAPMTESQGYREICAVAKSDHPHTMGRDGYEWAIKYGAEALQKANPALSLPQAYERFVTQDPIGRSLYNASVGRAAPVTVTNSAVAEMASLVDTLVAGGIAKSRPSAIAKVAADPNYRDLWERYKVA